MAYQGLGREIMGGLASTAHGWGFEEETRRAIIANVNRYGIDIVTSGRAVRLDIGAGEIAATAGYIGLALTGIALAAFLYLEIAPLLAPWLRDAMQRLQARGVELTDSGKNGWQEFSRTQLRAVQYQLQQSVEKLLSWNGRVARFYEFVWKSVEFDGKLTEARGTVFIEAKAAETFLQRAAERFPQALGSYASRSVTQLGRQIVAANDYQRVTGQAVRIEWRVETQALYDLLDKAFREAGLYNRVIPVTLKVVPFQ